MVHEMKLDREPFEKMKSGSKTVELRIFDDKRRCLEIDDGINIYKYEIIKQPFIVGSLQHRFLQNRR